MRITSGNVALGAGVVDSATNDVVAMDDFIIGTTVGRLRPLRRRHRRARPGRRRREPRLHRDRHQQRRAAPRRPPSSTGRCPNGAAQVSATPSQGNCPTVSSCDLGAIAAGASATLTVTVKPTAAGQHQGDVLVDERQRRERRPTTCVDVTTTVNAAGRRRHEGAEGHVISEQGRDDRGQRQRHLRDRLPGGRDDLQGHRAAHVRQGPARSAACKLRLDMGSAKFTVGGGKTAQVKVKLGAAERTLLKALGQIQVKVDVAVSDAAGNDATASRNVVLKARK